MVIVWHPQEHFSKIVPTWNWEKGTIRTCGVPHPIHLMDSGHESYEILSGGMSLQGFMDIRKQHPAIEIIIAGELKINNNLLRTG
jgi:hypothetical protein